MPKTSHKKIFQSNIIRQRIDTKDDFYLEIERAHKKDIHKHALSWPSHILVFGSTMSGKTSLIANMLDHIHLLYNFKSPHIIGKLIVISPIQTLEIENKLSSFSSWDIELYHDVKLDEDFEEHLIKQFRLTPKNMIKILLLDDTLTQANHTQIIFLNKLFTYFRHENISIIASIHSYDIKFSTIIDQSGLIVAMYCLNTSTVIRNILMRYLYKGSAKVWKELCRLFLTQLNKHDYVCLNFTKESLSSEVFFITNNLFHITKGIKLFQIINKM